MFAGCSNTDLLLTEPAACSAPAAHGASAAFAAESPHVDDLQPVAEKTDTL